MLDTMAVSWPVYECLSSLRCGQRLRPPPGHHPVALPCNIQFTVVYRSLEDDEITGRVFMRC